MLAFFLSPLPFILAFCLYIASDIIKRRRYAKYSKNMALIIIVVTFLVWINSLFTKMIDGQISLHEKLVVSVTYHVEKLLKNGDYKEAEKILNSFNSNYHHFSHDNEALKDFIKRLDVPLFSKEIEEVEIQIKNRQ